MCAIIQDQVPAARFMPLLRYAHSYACEARTSGCLGTHTELDIQYVPGCGLDLERSDTDSALGFAVPVVMIRPLATDRERPPRCRVSG
jgi:hypothetical protein